MIAIDAPHFDKINDPVMYKKRSIHRILNKAFSGLSDTNHYKSETKPWVVSGKWGCGAFNGDPRLVSVLQIMTCAYADRNVGLLNEN